MNQNSKESIGHELIVRIDKLMNPGFTLRIEGSLHNMIISLSSCTNSAVCSNEDVGVSPIYETCPESVCDQQSKITLKQLLDHYLEQRPNLRANTRKAYIKIIPRHLADWCELPITEISKTMVEERHQFISKDGGHWKASKVQANMTMRVLKLLLNFAMGNYERSDGKPLITFNPVCTLTLNKRWHRIPSRQGIIPDHKLAGWYAALNSDTNEKMRDYLLLVLLTGLRKNEAAFLTWADIDFESRTLEIDPDRTKNHKRHKLPLTPFLVDLLKRRYNSRSSDYVFPGRSGGWIQFHQIIQRIRLTSGCNFTVHDLRRTFLTLAERLDIPHYTLKKLANHSGGGDTTFGYLVVDTERLRAPMHKITDRFLKLMKVKC